MIQQVVYVPAISATHHALGASVYTFIMLYDVLTGKRPNDFKSSNFKRNEYSSKEGVAEEHGYIIKMELMQYTIHSTGCCQTNCSSSVTDTWQISKTNTIK